VYVRKPSFRGDCEPGWLFIDAFRREFPNCSARIKGERQVLVGLDLLDVKDVSSLAVRRPVDRGYTVAWDLQHEIWARALRRLFQAPHLTAHHGNVGLVLTEPYLNLPVLRESAFRVVFQELGFSSLVMAPPAVLALHWFAFLTNATATTVPTPFPPMTRAATSAGCALVIDAGFSFTHAVPIFDWHVVPGGIRRIDLGGKALTNYMKELVSYRSINMMDESYLLEYIKNQVCFVSMDPDRDLKAARRKDSPFRKEWLLPDGVTSVWGHDRDINEPKSPNDPILSINNERFMVPEALFNPTDLGMNEAGLAETAFRAVAGCHTHLHALLYSNVLIIGGTARCPGFKERFEAEFRCLVPDEYMINVTLLEDPHLAAWRGGAVLASARHQQGTLEFSRLAVTKSEWQQYGAAAAGKWDA
jgi:actin-related protein 6